MQIAKVLFTSKKLADGTHPVMIRFQHEKKTKYLSTGFSTSKSYWHKKNGLTQKSREADNREIDNILLKYQNRLNEILNNGQDPTFEVVMAKTPIQKATDGSNFIDVVKEKGKIVSATTKKLYTRLENELIDMYGSKINIKEINQVWFDKFREKIDKKLSNKNRMKNLMISTLYSSLNFGVKREYVEYLKIHDIKKFDEKRNEEKLNLSTNEITKMMMAYKKDVVLRARKLKKNELESIALYMLHLALQGLANVDVASIKCKQLEFKTIYKIDVDEERYNNNAAYKAQIDAEQEKREVVIINNIYRKKTGSRVKIVMDRESIEPLLEIFYYGKDENDYLIPCFNRGDSFNDKEELINANDEVILGKDRKPKTFTKIINCYYTTKTAQINRYMKEFCRIFEMDEIKHITYYMARHQFANRLNDLGISQNLIKKMMGQRTDVLQKSYLVGSTEWEQSEATILIFNQGETIKNLMEQRVSI